MVPAMTLAKGPHGGTAGKTSQERYRGSCVEEPRRS